MKSAGIAAVLAATTGFACSLDNPVAIDQEVALSRTVKMVPFKATQTATPGDASDVMCPPGEQAGKNLVVGRGTHLGKYTGETIGCIDPATVVWSRIEGTTIAANGDGVSVEMDPLNPGRFVFIDFTTGEFAITGGLVVVGGTGRFEGATGHSTFRSVGNLFVPGSTVTTNVGVISSPGSIKWSN